MHLTMSENDRSETSPGERATTRVVIRLRKMQSSGPLDSVRLRADRVHLLGGEHIVPVEDLGPVGSHGRRIALLVPAAVNIPAGADVEISAQDLKRPLHFRWPSVSPDAQARRARIDEIGARMEALIWRIVRPFAMALACLSVVALLALASRIGGT